jgi:serine/threonine protein phosphatase 1
MAQQQSTPSRSASRVPEGVRIYAVGDIHGQIELLDPLLERIKTHRALNPIQRPLTVFLGDYIDRGPASRDVVERLIEYGSQNECVFLKGNHEVTLISFFTEPRILDEWRKYGGAETLLSYGLKLDSEALLKQQADLATELWKALPSHHREFLFNLKSSFTCGDYFFVHAGVRPGITLNAQRDEDLLWIRNDFLDHEKSFEKTIVHGHTPVARPEIRPNRINIDTGAYATGVLTCLVLEADQRGFL